MGEPYHKLRLVPFGEYVPLRSLFGWVNQVSQAAPGAFTPGTRAIPLELSGVRLGGAICYEVVYPWIARAQVAAGADALYTLTNDAWYGDGGAQEQHWQAAVFRAVETGRPMLRAAVTGHQRLGRRAGPDPGAPRTRGAGRNRGSAAGPSRGASGRSRGGWATRFRSFAPRRSSWLSSGRGRRLAERAPTSDQKGPLS